MSEFFVVVVVSYEFAPFTVARVTMLYRCDYICRV